MGKAPGKPEVPQADKPKLKKMFGKAMKKPINCAVAKGPLNSVVMLLHKSKKDAGLKPLVEKEFGKELVSDIRWGTVTIDKKVDAKLAVLNMNKSLPGAAPKLKKWLKGCGVSKIRYMVEGKVVEEIVTAEPGDEDEPELMDDDDDDEDETNENENDDETANENETVSAAPSNEAAPPAPPAPEAAQSAAPPQSPAPPPPAAEQEPAPQFDAKGHNARLAALIKRMIQVATADPSRTNELKAMAVKAQDAIKASDPETPKVLDSFEAAIGNGAPPAAPPQQATSQAPAAPAAPPAPPAQPAATAQAPAAPAAPPPPMDPAKQAALAASPKIWNDTISIVSSGVGALKDAIRKDFASEAPEVVADIEKNLARIDQVTARFDRALADLLEGVNAATDDAARKAGLAKARSVLAEHIKYAASEPLIGMIDQNPFGVSPDIKKTLVANLTQLANAIR